MPDFMTNFDTPSPTQMAEFFNDVVCQTFVVQELRLPWTLLNRSRALTSSC